MVHTVLSTLVPGIAYVGEETDAPLLVDALTLSIRDGDADDGSALHVGECGLVRRDVLSQAGFDDDTSALALRLCLEPIVMVRKGFRDARLLRSDDPCIARQMLDLGRYRAPSSGSDGPVV
jgi:phenylalanyl-tRNA synthetase alpha chain